MSVYRHDELELRYEVTGVGAPVLCVHGATGTGAHEWSRLVAPLEPRYRFVVPDLRGHGSSDYRAGAMSIETVNGDLLELIAHEQLGSPHVLAFSFGAEVALDLELTHPGTAASLILLSPGLGDPKSSVPTRSQLEAAWPTKLKALHAERHGEEHWLEIMLELCDRAAVRPKADLDAVAEIRCPMLLVLGSNDDPRRLRQAEIICEAHDQTELVVIEGGRHAVHRDHSSETVAVIGAFLDQITATAGLGDPRS